MDNAGAAMNFSQSGIGNFDGILAALKTLLRVKPLSHSNG
jgi:hypothetical protein